MKKILITSFVFILFFTNISAQYIITKLWDKTLGGDGMESVSLSNNGLMSFNYNIGISIKIRLLPNGNILITGNSKSGISGEKTQLNWVFGATDIWLVTIDSNTGQKLADYRIGGVDLGFDYTADFEILPSGNYFLTIGSSASGVTGNYSVPFIPIVTNGVSHVRYLLLDSAFNKIWDRVIQGSPGSQFPTRMIWRDNRYYLLFWGSFLNSTELSDTLCDGENYGEQIGLGVYDSSGTIAWDHLYSGSNPSPFYNIAYDIIPRENNQYLISGITLDTVPGCEMTDSSAGRSDVLVFRIDSTGNVLWQRSYGGTGTDESRAHLLATNDGNYVFAAVSNSPQGGEISQPNQALSVPNTDSLSLWIVKINPNGGIIWDKRYGGCYSTARYCTAINTQDGGFLIGTTIGRTIVNSFINLSWQDSVPGCDVSEYGRGLADYWVIKLDSAGNKEWDKRWGGSERDGLCDLMQLSDGSYLAAGMSYSSTSGDKTEMNRDTSHVLISGINTPATMDYWVVRFRADKVVGIDELAAGSWQLSITPNPAKDNVEIAINNTSTPQHPNTLTLYDITGRALLQQPFNAKANLDVSKLSKGVYIVEVRNKDGHSVKGKLVKE